MTFMPLNAMHDHLPDFLDALIGLSCEQHRFLHRLRRLPRLRVHGAGDLVDVVAQAGQVRFQLVDFRWYGWGYGLEHHALPRILADGYYDQSSLGNYGAPSFGGTSHPYRHSRSFHGSSTFFVRFCGILCFLALLAGGLYLAAKSIWGLFENGIGTTVFYLFTGCFLIWGAHLMRVSTFDADDFEELGVEGGSIFVDLAMKICGLALLTIRLPVFQDLSLLLRLAIGISLIVGSHFARKAISRNY